MIQPLYNRVLVEADQEWKSQVEGRNGIVGIVYENDVDRSVGAQRMGKVVAVPRGVKDDFSLSKWRGEIRAGDIVFVHFNAISANSRFQVMVKDNPLYVVHLENVFAVLRGDKILMMNGRVLCLPELDPEVKTLDDGMKVKTTASGIITEINVVDYNIKRALLAEIGEHQEGCDARPGEHVYYAKDADFENEVNGTRYFCMVQDDILMVET